MVIIFEDVLNACLHIAKYQCSGSASSAAVLTALLPSLGAVIAAGTCWVLGSPEKIL